MSELSEQQADTFGSGLSQTKGPSSAIAGYLLPSKPQALTRKSGSCDPAIQKLNSSGTLDLVSTSTGKGFKPYWNAACKAMQSHLWLPHTIASVEQPSLSSSGSSNYTVGPSSALKRQYLPTGLTPTPCLPSLRASVPVTTAVGQVVASKKIRIYPKNEKAFTDLLFLQRRAYNLAIENIKKKVGTIATIRPLVREQTRSEYEGRTFISVVVDEAVNEAYATLQKCLSKWKNNKKAELHFRSRKDTNQTFVVQKLAAAGIFPRILGACHITEEVPDEAISCMARVTRRHGRWYIMVKKQVTLVPSDIQAGTTVALDPGVRTFMTAFSPSEAIKYGEDFAASSVFPLLLKRDSLLSKRQKLLNHKADAQWWYDRMREVWRRINRVSAQIEDRVSDLHRRTAYDLVSHYDTIIVPTFGTSQMVAREGRTLRRSSVRQMQSLGHFRFQQDLKWMCRKYGKSFVPCSEEYTSKTRSWDGIIQQKLGGAKTISDGVRIVDRDINGARGIFLRAHTRQLSPYSDPNVTVGTD